MAVLVSYFFRGPSAPDAAATVAQSRVDVSPRAQTRAAGRSLRVTSRWTAKTVPRTLQSQPRSPVNTSSDPSVLSGRRVPMIRARSLILASVAVASILVSRPAFAGPPLLCFPFEIGDARTLPMGTAGWHSIDPAYDAARLVEDTLAF